MKNTIDYYYAPVSGYAYLGEPRLVEIASKYNADIRYKPVDIIRVFAEAGTVPPPKQPKARLDYRLLDLKRTADYLGLPINPRPRHWPVPVELAARSIYAAIELGIDPHKISFAILSAVYEQEKDVSDEIVMGEIFAELNLDSDQMWSLIRDESTGKALEESTQEAIGLGIFGSPTYMLNGKDMYFGQDRLFLLEHKLSQ
ncbi:MAG: 2-hydroxychromene-2-carboxylate isomerase [Pseudomonadales bacterium]|nr:2-hydroxychromene-2-carboxylate isomerase [Pseudomonadales bacterium]